VAVLAKRLVDMAEPYYESANAGLTALPWRSAWAVATAGCVYREIGVKVRERGARAWDARVSTSKLDKLRLVSVGAWKASASRGRHWPARPAKLWQRPGRTCATGRHASVEAGRVTE